jgi:K+-transporting ATPase KdpF subunit
MTLEGLVTVLTQEFGLVLFTVLGVGLMIYLAYAMARAERH